MASMSARRASDSYRRRIKVSADPPSHAMFGGDRRPGDRVVLKIPLGRLHLGGGHQYALHSMFELTDTCREVIPE
jgi:hypothetical protein